MPVGSGYSPHVCTVGGVEYLPVVVEEIPSEAELDTEFEAVIRPRYPDLLDYSILTKGIELELVEGTMRVGRVVLSIGGD